MLKLGLLDKRIKELIAIKKFTPLKILMQVQSPQPPKSNSLRKNIIQRIDC